VALCVTAFETEDDVIVGSDSNFDEIIAANENVLVEFYAPWCGHCKSLAPEYAKAAGLLKESPAKLVKVDATIHSKVAERFHVQGYPTLKFFKKGQESDYNGGRTAKDIVAWLNKRSGPPAAIVDSVAAATKIQQENEVVILGFFSSETDAAAVAFVSAAEHSEDVFAFTTDATVAAHFSVTAPKVIALKKFDEGRVDFTGEFTSTDIQTFASGNQLPYVIEFSDAVAPKIFGGAVKTHVLLFAPKSSDKYESLIEAMRTVAKPNQGKLLFVYVNSEVPDHQRIIEFFGLSADELPAVRLISIAEEMAKFKPETTDITVEVLKKFADDFLSGALKKHLQSEKTPADWDSKPVKVLTGENFHTVIDNPNKHVFVEFYAPWCGHCKQLFPIWDQLAELFLGADNVVVAKIDSTANEIEGISIQSFPTLKLFPAGADKTPKDYSGGRDIKSLASYLAAETGAQVDLTSLGGASDAFDDHDHDGHEHDGHDHDHDDHDHAHGHDHQEL